jgi:hypothetical protein
LGTFRHKGLSNFTFDTPKRLRRLLRDCAATAHEEELRRALLPVAEAFKQWEQGTVESGELSELIHRFHQGPALSCTCGTTQTAWRCRWPTRSQRASWIGRRFRSSFLTVSRVLSNSTRANRLRHEPEASRPRLSRRASRRPSRAREKGESEREIASSAGAIPGQLEYRRDRDTGRGGSRPGRGGLHRVGQEGAGELSLLTIGASIDYRVGERDGVPFVEFSWSGYDEGKPASGRGWG